MYECKLVSGNYRVTEVSEGGFATRLDAVRHAHAQVTEQYRREKSEQKHGYWITGVRQMDLEALLHRIENESLPRKQRSKHRQPKKRAQQVTKLAEWYPDTSEVNAESAKHRRRSSRCVPYRLMGKIEKENTYG